MKRLVTGLLTGAFAVAAIVWLPSHGLLVVLTAVMTLAAVEMVRLARASHADPLVRALPFLVAGLGVAVAWLGPAVALATLVFAPVLLGVVQVWLRPQPGPGAVTVGWSSFGLPFLVLPIWAGFELHRLDWRFLLAICLSVWANDTAALVFGKLVGRHPMAPTLSPKKTWEGSAAGLVMGTLVGIGALWPTLEGFSTSAAVAVFCANVGAQSGDLMESMMKRSVSVKDSGRLLPGHGGLLDRLDAIIVAIPVFYALVRTLVLHGD